MDAFKDRNFYLKSLNAIGYKSLKALEVSFQKGLNIIIGPNGSGKSNLLEFIHLAYLSISKKQQIDFTAADLLFSSEQNRELFYEVRKGPSPSFKGIDQPFNEIQTVQLQQKLYLNGKKIFSTGEDSLNVASSKELRYPLYSGSIEGFFYALGLTATTPLFIRYAIPSQMPGITEPGSIVITFRGMEDDWQSTIKGSFLQTVIHRIRFDHLRDFAISRGPYENPFQTEEEDLIDFMHYTDYLRAQFTKARLSKTLRPDTELLRALERFSPIFDVRVNKNINVYHLDDKIVVENIKLEFLINSEWTPWSQLSDGTKRMFYIISEIHSMERGVVLLDEPELGIHPHQFELLMQFLTEQGLKKQFIISTHSPKTLDHILPAELDRIQIATNEVGKGTSVSGLSIQQLEKARDYISQVGFLSDYWLMSDLE